jgi:hypothetical protein
MILVPRPASRYRRFLASNLASKRPPSASHSCPDSPGAGLEEAATTRRGASRAEAAQRVAMAAERPLSRMPVFSILTYPLMSYFSYANLPSIRLKQCFVVFRYIDFLYCKKKTLKMFLSPWPPVMSGGRRLNKRRRRLFYYLCMLTVIHFRLN